MSFDMDKSLQLLATLFLEGSIYPSYNLTCICHVRIVCSNSRGFASIKNCIDEQGSRERKSRLIMGFLLMGSTHVVYYGLFNK